VQPSCRDAPRFWLDGQGLLFQEPRRVSRTATFVVFLMSAVYDQDMRIMRTLAVISAVSLGLAQPARAQDAPKFEFGAGYQYMHDNHSSTDYPKGWAVFLGSDPVSWFGIVGEVGGSHKTLASVGATDLDVNLYTFLVGPKFTATSKAPVAPFVQVLFGAEHGNLSLNAPNVDLRLSGTHFAVQPGVGIDFNPTPAFGLRVQADGRGVRTDDGSTNGQWRLLAALVFRR
jgi:hypothetical protein